MNPVLHYNFKAPLDNVFTATKINSGFFCYCLLVTLLGLVSASQSSEIWGKAKRRKRNKGLEYRLLMVVGAIESVIIT